MTNHYPEDVHGWTKEDTITAYNPIKPKDMKYDDNKILAAIPIQDFSLALQEIAKVSTYGADIYSRHSWNTVANKEIRYEDAMVRHLLAYNANEEFDLESGLAHRAHFVWNALATLQMYLERRNNKIEILERNRFP